MPMLRIPMTGGEDPKFVQSNKARNKFDDLIDVRDSISNLISRGKLDLKDPGVFAHFDVLSNRIGRPAAQKLMTKLMLYNQERGQQEMPLEEKVSMFYDTPDGDEELGALLKNVKGLGYGIKEGTRSSHDFGTIEAMGNRGTFAATRPVMLRVNK